MLSFAKSANYQQQIPLWTEFYTVSGKTSSYWVLWDVEGSWYTGDKWNRL